MASSNAWIVRPRARSLMDTVEDGVTLGCTLALIAAIVGAAWLVLAGGAP